MKIVKRNIKALTGIIRLEGFCYPNNSRAKRKRYFESRGCGISRYIKRLAELSFDIKQRSHDF